MQAGKFSMPYTRKRTQMNARAVYIAYLYKVDRKGIERSALFEIMRKK
jgi:hypothetical protein